nr:PREDICTED: bone morphogenetic protein receptor type-1B-like isoform X1 [Bemisia tabaci]
MKFILSIIFFVFLLFTEHCCDEPIPVTCYCEDHDCPHYVPGTEMNGTCILPLGAQCFSSIEETSDEEPIRRFGCLPPDESSDMQCKGNLSPHAVRKSIECCNFTDMCNQNLHPKLADKPPPVSEMSWEDKIFYTILCVSITFCVIFFIMVALIFNSRFKKQEEARQLNYLCHPILTPTTTLTDLIDKSSGSGSGLPIFVQRTIAKQIEPIKMVGKGRHGEVWLGSWRDDKVAVKIFSTTEEKSWFRETEIYQTVLMRHDNILGFVAADIKGTGSWTQMLLITEYHEFGSLYDYLQTNELDVSSLMSLICSAAAGVAHLHTEIFSTQGKPAIAHRDIKSKNILVKRNVECVIADFGLAVRYNSDSNEIDIARDNARVGTRRYMAPEVLDGTLDKLLNQTSDVRAFEALKMADIYSLSLVFWEMCRRCNGGKDLKVEEYALPYHDKVPSDPSFEDMHEVIVKGGVRPAVPDRWKESFVLNIISEIMKESWHPNPGVRPTALRIKKSLNSLRNSDKLNLSPS